MRRLEFYIILTADGMYADPDGGLDHYDPAEDEHRFANGLIQAAGDIVMGRGMYDVMEYWDTLDLDDPAVSDVEREYAEAWRATPKHVLSRGRPALRANANVIEGDAVDAVKRLKAGRGSADRARRRCGASRHVQQGWPDRHVPVPDHPDRAGRGQGDVRGARQASAPPIDRDADVLSRQRPAGVRTGGVATARGQVGVRSRDSTAIAATEVEVLVEMALGTGPDGDLGRWLPAAAHAGLARFVTRVFRGGNGTTFTVQPPPASLSSQGVVDGLRGEDAMFRGRAVPIFGTVDCHGNQGCMPGAGGDGGATTWAAWLLLYPDCTDSDGMGWAVVDAAKVGAAGILIGVNPCNP